MNLYESIVQQSCDFIATADLQGNLTYVNLAGRRMIGLGPDTPLTGLDFRSYLPDAWKDFHVKTVIPTVMRDGSWQGEMQIFNLQTEVPIDVFRTVFLLRDDQSQPISLASVTRDITEAKRAAGALQESEQKMRLIFEAARGHAIYMLDLRGRVVSWNASAARLCGYTEQEVLGSDFAIFFTPEEQNIGLPRRELDIARAEGRCEHDVWHTCKSGPKFWANVIVTAVYNGRGEHVGFLRITRDFTEHRNAQRALRVTEERFRALVDASAQVVWTVAGSGSLVEESVSWEAFTGQDYRSSYGFGWLNAFHPEDPASRLSYWRVAVEERNIIGCECRLKHWSGSWRWVHVRCVPLLYPDGRVREWVGMATDISEKKSAEVETAALHAELQQLNVELENRVVERTRELSAALRERDVLLQEVHHRVKNNLQVISSLISMQVRKAHHAIDREALEECQTRVLAIALIHEKLYQSKDYAHVPFADYVQMLASSVFQTCGASRENVSLDVQVGNVALPVDKAIPCGLLVNELISNALKHGFKDGRGGCVQVRLNTEDDGRLLLEVADNGVGWSPERDVWKTDSLGLQIVTALSDQLDAEVKADGSHGGLFQVRFAAEED